MTAIPSVSSVSQSQVQAAFRFTWGKVKDTVCDYPKASVISCVGLGYLGVNNGWISFLASSAFIGVAIANNKKRFWQAWTFYWKDQSEVFFDFVKKSQNREAFSSSEYQAMTPRQALSEFTIGSFDLTKNMIKEMPRIMLYSTLACYILGYLYRKLPLLALGGFLSISLFKHKDLLTDHVTEMQKTLLSNAEKKKKWSFTLNLGNRISGGITSTGKRIAAWVEIFYFVGLVPSWGKKVQKEDE